MPKALALRKSAPWLLGASFSVTPAAGASTLNAMYKLPASASTEFENVIYQNGLFYGTTFDTIGLNQKNRPATYGTVYSYDATTNTYTTLHTFVLAEGVFPNYSTPLTYVNGMLYGSTAVGGANNSGTVFQLDPTTGTETTLYNFTQHSGASQVSGMRRLPPKTIPWRNQPGSYSGVIYNGGFLYGTTHGGGSAGLGTIFQIDLTSGTETTLYSFTGATDGAAPEGRLLYNKSKLYGTTTTAGTGNVGTAFQFDVKKGKLSTLHGFAGGSDGADPVGGLIIHKATLYGVTTGGGTSGVGTAFALDTKTGVETVLYSFTGNADGAEPNGNLIYQKGNLYGTALHGGDSQQLGSIFAVNAQTGVLTSLYVFVFSNIANGCNPQAGLIFAKGLFYGTTTSGGHGWGTLYQFQP